MKNAHKLLVVGAIAAFGLTHLTQAAPQKYLGLTKEAISFDKNHLPAVITNAELPLSAGLKQLLVVGILKETTNKPYVNPALVFMSTSGRLALDCRPFNVALSKPSEEVD